MSPDEGGEWRTHTFAWWEAVNVYCDLCGRPLAGRAWVAVVEGEERTFCDSECVGLYRTHRIAG